MKSDSSTGRITVSGVRDDVLEELDALADAEDKSRSEKVVELIEREVADSVPNDDGEYLPASDRLRDVYLAVLEVAKKPDHTLRLDIHGGEVSQKAGLSKSALRGNLFRLQSRGFVKHQRGRDATGQHGEVYHVKPRCANPKTWKYSDARDPTAVAALEADELDEPATGAEESGDVGDQLDALTEAGEEVSQSAD